MHEVIPYPELRKYIGKEVHLSLWGMSFTLSGILSEKSKKTGVLSIKDKESGREIDVAGPGGSQVLYIQLYVEYLAEGIDEQVRKTTDIKDIHFTRSPINPVHYQGGIQPIDLITSQGLGFNEGNAVKYICRWRKKNGVEDLKKAIRYIQFEINIAEGRQVREDSESI